MLRKESASSIDFTSLVHYSTTCFKFAKQLPILLVS
jgi:hypothetical protein